MHPSFEMVLDFVKNEAISVHKVHSLLQQRAKLASSVTQAYTMAAEYIRTLTVPHVFEVSMQPWLMASESGTSSSLSAAAWVGLPPATAIKAKALSYVGATLSPTRVA